MARVRVRRADANTLRLLLKLTNRHVHAQLVDKHAGRVVLAAHTTEPVVRDMIDPNAVRGSYVTASVAAAGVVGKVFAQRAAQMGISDVYWQRPGRYHGKIKAFIDAVREGGVSTSRAPSYEMPPVPPLKRC